METYILKIQFSIFETLYKHLVYKLFGGEIIMTSSNKKVVPEAKESLDKFKYEIANEMGISLKDGYNGNLSSRDAGRIGGNMVRKLIEQAEKNMTK